MNKGFTFVVRWFGFIVQYVLYNKALALPKVMIGG